MFDWVKVILAALTIIEKLINYFHDRGLIDQGRREEIAASAQRIAIKMSVKAKITEQVHDMSEAEVDDALRDLVTPVAGTETVHPRGNG